MESETSVLTLSLCVAVGLELMNVSITGGCH